MTPKKSARKAAPKISLDSAILTTLHLLSSQLNTIAKNTTPAPVAVIPGHLQVPDVTHSFDLDYTMKRRLGRCLYRDSTERIFPARIISEDFHQLQDDTETRLVVIFTMPNSSENVIILKKNGTTVLSAKQVLYNN